MIVCAGVLFVATDGRVLLLHRSDGAWGFPGGHCEGDETLEETAARECIEEMGSFPPGADLWDIASERDGVSFTTFAREVPEPFSPTLNDEHTEFGWFPADALPEGTLPGAASAVRRLSMTERDVAAAMAAGEFAGPAVFYNTYLVALRITGTGFAWRDTPNGTEAAGEFSFRNPEEFLTPEFVDRCNAMPVLLGHPDDGVLRSSEDYTRRNVGSIMYPYIRDGEVWGIARLYSADTARRIALEPQSTSPGVLIGPEDKIVSLRSGDALRIEGRPALLDHLALCPLGVWDKGGPPAGVDSPQVRGIAMADEDRNPAEQPRADADTTATPPATPDGEMQIHEKLLAALGGIQETLNKHDTAIEALLADRGGKPVPAADCEDVLVPGNPLGEPPAGEVPIIDSGAVGESSSTVTNGEEMAAIPKEVQARLDAAEKALKDAERRADAAEKKVAESLADFSAALNPSAEDRNALADEVARADSVFSLFGKEAPRPVVGERAERYLQRTADRLKSHSARWKDTAVGSLTGNLLRNASEDIYASAIADARAPVTDHQQPIQKITKMRQGHQITEYRGSPRVAWGNWASPTERGFLRTN